LKKHNRNLKEAIKTNKQEEVEYNETTKAIKYQNKILTNTVDQLKDTTWKLLEQTDEI